MKTLKIWPTLAKVLRKTHETSLTHSYFSFIAPQHFPNFSFSVGPPSVVSTKDSTVEINNLQLWNMTSIHMFKDNVHSWELPLPFMCFFTDYRAKTKLKLYDIFVLASQFVLPHFISRGSYSLHHIVPTNFFIKIIKLTPKSSL